MSAKEIYEDGIEQAKTIHVVFENILIIIFVSLGCYSIYPVGINGVPVLSMIYVLFAIIMFGIVLRKQICTVCYYYGKRCHCGWGLLSSKMFEKDCGNQKTGTKLAGLTWGVLTCLPLIVMAVLIITGTMSLIDEMICLVPFLIVVIINGLLHKKTCEQCKMRFICSASNA